MRRPIDSTYDEAPSFRTNNDGAYTGYHDVLCLALQREEARRDNNYREADRIRDDLIRHGTELNDQRHAFTLRNLVGSYDLHAGIGEQEIQIVALEREEARRDRNFARADELRDWLAQLNVTVDDRSHTARLADGRTCSYDLYNQVVPQYRDLPRDAQVREKGAVSRAAAARQGGTREAQEFFRERQVAGHYSQLRQQPSPVHNSHRAYGAGDYGADSREQLHNSHNGRDADDGVEAFRGYTEVLLLAFEREEARRDNNYKEADRVRMEMSRRGAEVSDKSHTFTYRGLRGTYDLRTGVGTREVQYAALEREEARRDRDYARSDQLRAWLGEQGITVDDKVHTFTMPNGARGSYDLRAWEPIFDEGHREFDSGFDGRGGMQKRQRFS